MVHLCAGPGIISRFGAVQAQKFAAFFFIAADLVGITQKLYSLKYSQGDSQCLQESGSARPRGPVGEPRNRNPPAAPQNRFADRRHNRFAAGRPSKFDMRAA